MNKNSFCQGGLCSQVLMVFSGICVVLAVIGAAGSDIYLASTQWVLLAILLAVYSLWFGLKK
jgi:hypothetical protein